MGKNNRKLIYSKKVLVYLTETKFQELTELLPKANCRSMSELIRYVLDRRRISVAHYDSTMDGVMWELAGFRTDVKLLKSAVEELLGVAHQSTSAGEHMSELRRMM